MYNLLYLVPKNLLSLCVGYLVLVPVPGLIGRWIVAVFVRAFGIDMSEAEKPIDEYPTIGALFVRRLKGGARPIGRGIASPVDGTLRALGNIQDSKIEAVKGRSYAIQKLLGEHTNSSRFQNGSFVNLYLGPPDYHRVHSPLDGKIVSSTHIPGCLWPVNDWAFNNVHELFCVNERLVTYIETEFGLAAVVMVGATNVGKITVSYDDWRTNALSWPFLAKGVQTREYSSALDISKGGEIGVFHMGSAVILLFEGENLFSSGRDPGPVKCLESLVANP